MDINIAFQHFLMTGQLGGIDLNTSMSRVFELLGVPDKTKTEYWELNNIYMTNLYYENSLIFTFLGPKLHLIILSCKSEDVQLPSRLEIPWISRIEEMTYNDFCDYLKENDIKFYQVDVTPFEDEGVLLWLPQSQIEVVFDAARDYHIHQISCLADVPTGWKLKEG